MSQSDSSARTWHVLVPDARDAKILLRVARGHSALPTVELTARHWWEQPQEIRARVQQMLKLDATVLRCLESRGPFDADGGLSVFLLEPRQVNWVRPAGTDWFGPEDLATLVFADERQRQLILRYFDEELPERSPAWTRRGWMGSTVSWLETEFDRLDLRASGRIEQVHLSSVGALLRVPVEGESIYLKVCGDGSAHQPELTALLWRECPRLLPGFLAADSKRRFLLERDAGQAAQPDPQAAEWLIRGLAEVQMHTAERPERLLEVGCPDDRPEILRTRIPGFVDDLARRFEGTATLSDPVWEAVRRLPEMPEAWAELAEGEVPAALHHPRFGPESLVSRAGQYSVTGWCGTLSHPFFTPSPLIESFDDPEVRQGLLDLYLEHWTGFAPRERLVELYRRSRLLEKVYRAMLQLDRLDQVSTLGERRREVERLAARLCALCD